MAIDSLSERAAEQVSRRARWVWALAPIALWLVVASVLGLLASGITSPRRFQDEFLYWGLARSFASGHGLAWHAAPYPVVSSFYPIVISLAGHLSDTVSGQYAWIKQINAVVMSAVIFPVYVAARWYVSRPLALLGALLAAIVPAMNYVGMIGTETLAYPLAAAALVALVRAIGRPGPGSTAVFAVAFAFAAFSRVQFVSMLPVAALAAGLAVLLGERALRRQRLAELKWLWALLGAAVLLGIVYVAARGYAAVGIYLLVVKPIAIAWSDADYWLRAFSADIYILAALIPTIATFSLLAPSTSRRDPLVAALAAVALVASIVFVLQMTWFTMIGFEHARERHILYERYLFYLGPLYFVGLMVALQRASARAVVVSTLVGTGLIALLPSQAILVPISQDAFSLTYLGYLIDEHPRLLGWSGVLIAAIALLLGALLALARRGDPQRPAARYSRLAVLILPIFLMLIAQLKAWSYQQVYADGVRNASPQPLNWVARATDRPAGQIVAEGTDRLGFFLTGFWNPNVDRLYVTQQPPIGSYLVTAPTCPLRWANDGRILQGATAGCAGVPAAWVLESPTLVMQMRDEVSRVGPRRTPSSTLLVVNRPPRIFSLLGGRNVRDGRVHSALVLRSFLGAEGRLRVSFAARKSAVTILLDGKRVRLAPGRSQTLSLRIGRGERLTRIERRLGAGELFADSVELREGSGPWRSID